MAGFFGKAKARVSNFFQKMPSNITKARSMFNTARGVAGKANRFIQYTNEGVQQNDLFGRKVKDVAKKGADLSGLGLKKIDDVHKGGDKFLEHMARYGADAGN